MKNYKFIRERDYFSVKSAGWRDELIEFDHFLLLVPNQCLNSKRKRTIK